MKRLLIILSAFLCATMAHADRVLDVENAAFTSFSLFQPGGDPTTGVLPAYNDNYANWSVAGVPGGIPTRSTVCSTLSPSGGDDTTAFNAAVAACPAGDVLMLASGSFQMTDSDVWLINKGITVRGTGSCTNSSAPYCATSIVVTNGALPYVQACGTSLPGGSCTNQSGIVVGPALFNNFWSGCAPGTPGTCAGAIKVDADAALGDTTVQVHSTSGFSVGGWVLIDEATGSGWITDPIPTEGLVWGALDALGSSGSPTRGNVIWQKHNPVIPNVDDFAALTDYPYNTQFSNGCYWSFCDRPTAEMKKVSAIGAGPCPGTACTLTFDSPLTTAFRRSGPYSFTGTMSATTLTTTGDSCQMIVGQAVQETSNTGTQVKNNTYVSAVNSCSAGVGNYTISVSQTVAAEAMQGAAHGALVYTPSSTLVQGAGVENLSISRTSGSPVQLVFCVGCWVKGVDAYNWIHGFQQSYVARSDITYNYAHDCYYPVNSGAEYPIDLQNAVTETHVYNNITRLCGKAMTARGAGGGDVIGYNYFDATYYLYVPGDIGDYWVEVGTNGSHSAGTHGMLLEGNWGYALDSDNTHGASMYMTYFRNLGSGYRSPFTDPSIPAAVNDLTNTNSTGGASSNGPLRAAGPMAYSYWFGYVGNVLGTSGHSTSGNGWADLCASSGPSSAGSCIWSSGWQNWTYLSDPNLNSLSSSAYILRHANYDYFNSAVTYASGYSHTLPNSFYLASVPSYFSSGASCSYPWPWITPTGGSQIQPASGGGSCSTYSGLPAKARWDAGTPFVQP